MKSIKYFCVLLILGAYASFYSGRGSREADQSSPKPNVILIMADDLGAETITSYGGESYVTPYVDHLAETGVRFENAYTTPLCTPTRVQLMTGQYPFRNGWTGGIWNKPVNEQFLSPEIFNMGQMFKNAGYKTAVAGKWQLARFKDRPDHPKKLGYDEYCLWTWKYEGIPPESGIKMEGKNKPSRFWSPGVWKNGRLMENVKGKFGPDIYTGFITNFIEKHQKDQFFIYYPMALTHWPFVPVPGKKDGTKENSGGQTYFADMVNYADKLVGHILQKLDMLGIRDNTLVIFTGDNGNAKSLKSIYQGDTIRGGKSMMNEAGTRVPFIASWPAGIQKGKEVNDFVDLADVLPTLADAIGYTLPDSITLDGESILPVLKGESSMREQWVFCQRGKQWFIRNNDWRLHQDGAFYKMENRYNPAKMTEKISPRAQKSKQKLSTIVRQLLPDVVEGQYSDNKIFH